MTHAPVLKHDGLTFDKRPGNSWQEGGRRKMPMQDRKAGRKEGRKRCRERMLQRK